MAKAPAKTKSKTRTVAKKAAAPAPAAGGTASAIVNALKKKAKSAGTQDFTPSVTFNNNEAVVTLREGDRTADLPICSEMFDEPMEEQIAAAAKYTLHLGSYSPGVRGFLPSPKDASKLVMEFHALADSEYDEVSDLLASMPEILHDNGTPVKAKYGVQKWSPTSTIYALVDYTDEDDKVVKDKAAEIVFSGEIASRNGAVLIEEVLRSIEAGEGNPETQAPVVYVEEIKDVPTDFGVKKTFIWSVLEWRNISDMPEIKVKEDAAKQLENKQAA